jgi:hypothetical protein
MTKLPLPTTDNSQIFNEGTACSQDVSYLYSNPLHTFASKAGANVAAAAASFDKMGGGDFCTTRQATDDNRIWRVCTF